MLFVGEIMFKMYGIIIDCLTLGSTVVIKWYPLPTQWVQWPAEVEHLLEHKAGIMAMMFGTFIN